MNLLKNVPIFGGLFAQPKNLCSLLELFFEKHPDNPTLQQFYDFIDGPEEFKSGRLLEAFGFLQGGRIVRKLKLSESYRGCYGNLQSDFILLRVYNLDKLKNIKFPLDPLPPSERRTYSWNKNTNLDRTSNSQYGFACVGKFFKTVEFPLELARIMGFFPSPLLKSLLETETQELNKTVAIAFEIFQKVPIRPLSDYRFTPNSWISFQSILCRHAAMIEISFEGSRLLSFAEEIINYAKIQPQQVLKDELQLKLFHLIDFTFERVFFEEKEAQKEKETEPVPSFQDDLPDERFFSDKEKGKERKKESASTSYQEFLPDKRIFSEKEKEGKGTEEEFVCTSFQQYLIEKTLSQVTFYCPLAEEFRERLAHVFVASDEDRRLVCFFVFVFGNLFHSNFPFFSELMGLKGTESRRELVVQAFKMLDLASVDASSETRTLLPGLLHILYFDEFMEDRLKARARAGIFHWVCNTYGGKASDPTAILSMFEKMRGIAPKKLYKLLLDTFFEVNEERQLSLCNCLRQLNEIHEYAYDTWIDNFGDVDTFLSEYINIEEEPHLYHVLAIWWHFLVCEYYLNLDLEGKEILADHLIVSNSEEREILRAELALYKRGLKFENAEGHPAKDGKSPKERRISYIQKGLEKYLSNAPKQPDPAFQEMLERGPQAYGEPIHFGIIKQVESFCGHRLDIKTVFKVLCYPIFLPCVLDLFSRLTTCRRELFSPLYRNNFFLPHSLIQEKTVLLQAHLDFSIPCSYMPQSSHISTFDRSLHTITYYLETFLFPDIKFMMTISNHARMLALDESSSLIAELQNVLYPLSPADKQLGILYHTSWKRARQGNYFKLILTLMRSLDNPESLTINCPLYISIDTFKAYPQIIKILQVLLSTLWVETEEPEIENEYLERKKALDAAELTLMDEFDLICSLYPKIKVLWGEFVETTADPQEEIKARLLAFVKNLKIESRAAVGSLIISMPSSKAVSERRPFDLMELASYGYVYALEKGLSLIPRELISYDPLGFYQLRADQLCEEFSELRRLLKEQAEEYSANFDTFDEKDFETLTSTVKTNFFTFELQTGEEISVDVFFHPHPLTASMAKAHGIKSKKRGFYHEIKFIPRGKKSCAYSLKLKKLINHPNLEQLLRWMFCQMLSRCYYLQKNQEETFQESERRAIRENSQSEF